MEVVSSGPLRVAPIRWVLSNGARALTVVCKGTFSLRPGESPLAQQQDEPNEDDTYWDDDPQRSLSASTDLVPFKARADVVLAGSAFSPKPARSVVARLHVGSVDKAIEVHADRAFGPDGVLREGMPFSKMRLRYERAAGGPDTANPVGMRFDVHDARGNVVLPNLQPPGAQVRGRGEGFAPIGFGPIAPMWPERAAKIQRSSPGWSPYGWVDRPLPEPFDASYFNVAPADQQLDALPPGVELSLSHLHPEHPRLVTRLADIVPRAMVERPGHGAQPLPLVCDTLSIDTDRGICHLVWRGTVRLSHPAEQGRIVVSLVQDEPSWGGGPSVEEMGDKTMMPVGLGPIAAMPFLPRPAAGERPVPPPPPSSSSALPFHREGAPRDPAQPVSSPRAAPPPAAAAPAFSPSGAQAEGTRVYEVASPYPAGEAPLPTVALPPPAPPPPPPAPLPPPARSTGEADRFAPPVAGPLPPPVAPRPVETSPWAAPGVAAEAPSGRGSVGERQLVDAAPLSAAESERQRRGEPEHLGALPRPAEAALPSFLAAAAAATAGVVAASNAAADPAPPRAASPGRQKALLRTSEAVDLLWFDAESVGRIRKRPPWRTLLSDLESSNEVDAEDSSLGNTPEEIEDRRDLLHILANGAITDAYGLSEALEQAVRADGKIIHPLVLTAGQLTFWFDELEMLKATLSAALPFAQGDEQLTAATDAAKEFLSTPGLLATGTVIESLTLRVREAFARVKRPVAADYLTVQSERALLEKRHYQKREVFSKTHLRGLLFPIGANDPIPAYLPEDVSKKLPLYQRFGVRMIVEVHRTADQNEVHPAALRVFAVGRTLPAR